MTWSWTDESLGKLSAHLGGGGTLTAREIGDGHSNLTYLVTGGERPVVVRRPPPPPVPPGGHDVLREARLILAIQGAGVPVPEVYAVAQEGEVLDFPFYVMSYVDGVVSTTDTPAGLVENRAEIAYAMVDTLAALHAVDWRAAGLEGFGRPEGFNARHLRRMAGLVDGQKFEPVRGWLEANVPPESGDAILHNDFRVGNVMLSKEPPARILAVLDWELATIGDPLLDVGYFLASYPEGESETPTQDLGTMFLEPGYPTRAELAERYAADTGRDLSNLRWYTVMALWKLAVLYEYAHRRGEDAYYQDPALVARFLAAASREAGLAAVR
jgi:aminoglycoside phosphotransferase (APT) family kinase protein